MIRLAVLLMVLPLAMGCDEERMQQGAMIKNAMDMMGMGERDHSGESGESEESRESTGCAQQRQVSLQQWQQQRMMAMWQKQMEDRKAIECVSAVCTLSGKLADRIRKNMNINDVNKDGVVTGDEVYDDLGQYYDKNNDGCVSRAEWVYRWITFYNFTLGYAEERLNEIVGPDGDETCLIRYSIYQGDPNFRITMNDFVNANIQSLVEFCNKDRLRYMVNCDCSQLAAVCALDEYFSTIDACVKFVRGDRGGEEEEN